MTQIGAGIMLPIYDHSYESLQLEGQMLKRGFKVIMAEANAVIESVSVQDAAGMVDDPGVTVIDVREAVERERDGAIPGSIHATRGMLEFAADPESPAHNDAFRTDRRLLLYCGSGGRSLLAAKTLHDMGYPQVLSLAGGYTAWAEANKK